MTAVAQDARSQTRNRELALERLQRRLSAALTPAAVASPRDPQPRSAAGSIRSAAGCAQAPRTPSAKRDAPPSRRTAERYLALND